MEEGGKSPWVVAKRVGSNDKIRSPQSPRVGEKKNKHTPRSSSTLSPSLTSWLDTISLTSEERESCVVFFETQLFTLEALLELRESTFHRLRVPITQERKVKMWEAIVDLQQRHSLLTCNVASWDNHRVCQWVREKGWIAYENSFVKMKVTGMSLLLLQERDLESFLGVQKAGVRFEMMNAITELLSASPAAQELLVAHVASRPKENELIAVSIQLSAGGEIFTRGKNWDRLQSMCSLESISPVIAFVGPTAAGKSRLLSTLLPCKERMEARIPILAAAVQRQSTTANVSLFFGSLTLDDKPVPEQRILLLDLEGEGGTIPIELKEEVKACKSALEEEFKMESNNAEKNATLKKKHLKDALAKRMAWIKVQLPQLAYLVSNVVVYVDRHPMHNKQYQERIMDFAKRATPTLNSSDRPHLILVQNFCPDNDSKEYTIGASTKAFHSLLEQYDDWKDVESNFTSVHFVKIPDHNKNADLYVDQISAFQDLLGRIVEPASSFRLNAQNLFTENVWFDLVAKVLSRGQDDEINMPELFFEVCRLHNPFLRGSIEFFTRFYSALSERLSFVEPSFWAGNNVQAFAERRIENFRQCLDTSMYKLAEMLVSQLKKDKLQGGFGEGDILSMHGNFTSCLELLLHRMPCAYRTEKAFCVIEKASHHKHRLYKPDPHKAPKFKDKKSAFLAPDIDIEHLRQKFTAYAKDLLAKSDIHIFERKWKQIWHLCNSPDRSKRERDKLRLHRFNFCMICQANSELVLVACGHAVCRSCSGKCDTVPRFEDGFICPICNTLQNFYDPVSKLPKLVRPRVLALDGDGMKLIVQLKILQLIAKVSGLKIHQLFDVIAASSASTLLAACLGILLLDIKETETVFQRLRQVMFPASTAVRGGGDLATLLSALKAEFGDRTLLSVADSRTVPEVLMLTSELQQKRPFAMSTMTPGADVPVSFAIAAASCSSGVPHNGVRLGDAGALFPPAKVIAKIVSDVYGESPSLLVSLPTERAQPGTPGRETWERVKKFLGAKTLCYRINGPTFQPRTAGEENSRVEQTTISAATNKWLESSRKQQQLCSLGLQLVAQVLYIDAVGAQAFLASRVTGHFVGSEPNCLAWKGSSTTGVLQVLLEGNRLDAVFKNDRWQIEIPSNLARGEYTLAAQVIFPNNSPLHIGGSPCKVIMEDKVSLEKI